MVRRRWAIAGVIVLAVVVAIVSLFALLRDDGTPSTTGQRTLPIVDFSASVSPSPAPTTTGPESARADQRFIIASADSLWRATAGACGRQEPVVERSVDGGKSWRDVTPRYRDIAQVASLDVLGQGGAEMVAATGADCTPAGLRSFTGGKFWEPHNASLEPSRYLKFDDARTVVSPGDDFAAPCADARGLRATGKVVAVICDGSPYVRTGTQWTKLDATRAVALSIASGDLYVAQTGVKGCKGIALTRFIDADGDGAAAGCAADAPPTGVVAITTNKSRTYVWSGKAISLIPH